MGVVSIHQFPIPEGKSGQQAAELLQKRLETLGAVREGIFTVDCETYYSAPNLNPSHSVNIIHDTEHPATCFALLDTGMCLVADITFDMLMLKMAGIYSSKKSTKIESRGPRYEVADFLVKVGSVSMGPSFRGILVEVEYLPCVVPSSCWDLMREFLQGFMGSAVQGPPQYLQGRMNELYNPVDTVQQYMEHFNNFRRASATPVAAPTKSIPEWSEAKGEDVPATPKQEQPYVSYYTAFNLANLAQTPPYSM
ncbi:mediator of RNA polymerase II transcription subunit 20 isoform X1 [Dermacentor silvarum]|uniref:mediator of RNA polymerase II transcription subunit 20 isoform X1 n=1 Tax=Dermacentor silvarum TaxID=543639 RepID=UPI002101BB52|nr:mediator of RNA polymerase II transcription subunit 20 isoform X1 [Dermacentor silvarum]